MTALEPRLQKSRLSFYSQSGAMLVQAQATRERVWASGRFAGRFARHAFRQSMAATLTFAKWPLESFHLGDFSPALHRLFPAHHPERLGLHRLLPGPEGVVMGPAALPSLPAAGKAFCQLQPQLLRRLVVGLAVRLPEPHGCGCQNRFGIPFWLLGEFTTHFRTILQSHMLRVFWERWLVPLASSSAAASVILGWFQ